MSLPLHAQMNEITDAELSNVSAQAGISINIGNSQVRITADSYRFSDTDHTPHNWLEFNNITVSGPGGYFSIDTPIDPYMTYDVATGLNIDGTSRTYTHYYTSHLTNPRTYEIENFVFYDGALDTRTDLGSITLDTRMSGPMNIRVSSHQGAGTQGIESELLTKWVLEDFVYRYNSGANDTLHVQNITLCETATGNPTSPGTWDLSGQFRFGDLFGGVIDTDDNASNQAVPNPITFDVGTSNYTDPTTEDTTTYAVINIPMKGTVRVEKVTFGGNDFGPCAIDNITVHHLYIGFSGN